MNLSNIQHLDQWFGLWAMEATRFNALHAAINGLDLHLHFAQAAAADGEGTGWAMQFANGVAVVHVRGLLMKSKASIGPSTSTVLARRQVRQAVERPDVKAIVLFVESGGGTVAGTAEFAADVAAAARLKPVWSYIEDVGASAAYHVASQASKIFANASAVVGSIGTFGVVHDSSGRAEREGIKVHVVRAGAFKGAGAAGTKIEAAHLAELQKLVDGHQARFSADVAAGRRMSSNRVAELADGRLHLAAHSQSLGLIDGVATWDQTWNAISQLAAGASDPKSQPAAGAGPRKGNHMSATQEFERLVCETMAAKKCDRGRAVSIVARVNPKLRLLWVAEHNEQKGHHQMAQRVREQAEQIDA